MVLTRSADKRLAQSKEDDLVLRSRGLHEALEETPTGLRRLKRDPDVTTSYSTPRKRTRLSQSTTHESGQIQGQERDLSVTKAETVLEPKDEKAPEVEPSLNTGETPQTSTLTPTESMSAANQESTPKQVELFQTPATSKHMRFGSEEPTELLDSIAPGNDSSPHNGYETAEETIDDGEDAPEALSAKVAPTQTPSQAARKTKSRPSRQQPSQREAADFSNINQTPTVPSMPPSGDHAVESDPPETATTFQDTEVSPGVPPETKHLAQPDTLRVNETPAPPPPGPSTDGLSNKSLAAVGKEPKSPQSKSPSGQSYVAPTRTLFSTASSSSNTTNTVKLPDPARSTMSNYRRNKLESRYKLESKWNTKRSTFAIS